MTNRIFAPSYERGLELIAAGCPIDYPDAQPAVTRKGPHRFAKKTKPTFKAWFR